MQRPLNRQRLNRDPFTGKVFDHIGIPFGRVTSSKNGLVREFSRSHIRRVIARYIQVGDTHPDKFAWLQIRTHLHRTWSVSLKIKRPDEVIQRGDDPGLFSLVDHQIDRRSPLIGIRIKGNVVASWHCHSEAF